MLGCRACCRLLSHLLLPMPADAMAVYGRILLQAPAAIMQVCSAAAATPGLHGQLDPQQGQDHSSQVQHAGSCMSTPENLHCLTLKLKSQCLALPGRVRSRGACGFCTTLPSQSRHRSFCTASALSLFVPEWRTYTGLSPIPYADAQVLLALLDRWLDRFDSVSSAGARRLSALALCVALTVPLPAVLDRLDVIAACLTAVAAEVSTFQGCSGCMLQAAAGFSGTGHCTSCHALCSVCFAVTAPHCALLAVGQGPP